MNMKRIFSAFLALLMTVSVTFTDYHYTTEAEAASSNGSQYGLVEDIQDGMILHCWDWSFNNIAEQMENIAAAGYSAVQTSPIQEAKEPTAGVSNANWWVFYQPKSFTIDNSGDSGLGTKAEFEAMCDVAEQYGIKVIVDIVANHTGNDGNGGIAATVISDIKNDSNCYHNYGNFSDINYGSRYSITHDSMGLLPDLNTENTKIQNYVISLLKECIDAGADGFRFDAAKHISVPSEGSEYTFWPNVINTAKTYASSKGVDLYCYGEILDGTSGPAISDYTQYMSVTDNQTSADIRNGVKNGNAAAAATSNYQKGTAASNIVLWAESHDEFQNESRVSTGVSAANIKKAWAIVASRANAAGLYYVRTTGWRTGTIGEIGTWDWKSTEVAEVNKFHNAFVGQSEYMSYSGSIAMNERGTSGAVLVNCSGTSTSVNMTVNKMASGTYTDQITGNTFTVSNGKLSGQIGSTGIAVVYNAKEIVSTPTPTISREGGEFSSDTLTLTLGLKNAESGTYKIGSDSAVTYTSTKTITIGSGMAYGDSVQVTLTATNGTETITKTYTFKKVEKSANIAYLKLPSGWSSPVYCYAYDSATETVNNGTWPGETMTYDSASGYYMYEISDDIKAPRVIFYSSDSNRYPAEMEEGLLFSEDGGWLYADGTWKKYTDDDDDITDGYVVYLNMPSGWSAPVYCYAYDSATETVNNGAWPGQTMTYDAASGYYKYTVPSNIEAPRVIFYSSDSNRYPGAMETGLLCSAEGSWLYSNGTWSTYKPPVKEGTVTVKYVDESGNTVAASVTMTGTIGDAYTTTAASVDGYTLKTKPSNASGTYTESDITVTYVYEEIADTTPVVIPSITSGSSFKTDTKTIQLTLKNAVSGTYTVDDGPEKTFTGTVDVVLGQGKVADSVVTVKATAVGSDGTKKSYTFTYDKIFGGVTINESAVVPMTIAEAEPVSSGDVVGSLSLASKYSTNADGMGANKTITVDGDISDWDSSMIIAQGTANDDPRVYRDNSMYEIPIDLYTLYGAWDNENLYLMWEMTNVQDVVAPNDSYPLSQGVLYQTMNVPFFIAVDTGKSSTEIGNNGQLVGGGTLWDSGITIQSSFNKLIAISTNGANGPFVYGGDSTGLNPVEETSYAKSGIQFDYGMGILSTDVTGINKGYGSYNGRVVGDVCNESAEWVEFNSLGHNSAAMDFHYEMAIPFEALGVTAAEVKASGLGVMLISTMGKSGMDCLPYDLSMNDNADLPDTQSQEFNSYEKSDEDHIQAAFARVGAEGDITPDELVLNFGADRSAPQVAGTALTLSGIAQGGEGDYTYEFYVDDKLVKKVTSSGSAEASWTPATEGTYLIECMVTDSAGTSEISAKYYTVEKKSGTDVTISKVTGLTAVYKDGKIVLNWDNNNAVKYRVMRFDGINPGYTTLTYSASAGGYVDTDLINAHRYYYRVCGYFYNESGTLVQGGVSASAGVVATDIEPGKVENVQPVVSGRQVTLTWDAAEGVRYYKIARAYGATTAEGSYITLKYNVEETSHVDTTIKYAGTYRYKVMGYYKAVDGSWTYGPMSNTLFVTVK